MKQEPGKRHTRQTLARKAVSDMTPLYVLRVFQRSTKAFGVPLRALKELHAKGVSWHEQKRGPSAVNVS